MKGDFSRNTFDPQHRFARVLMQQGRVLLDADWNEQTSILLHYLRTLASDLIGPHGGPGDGFKILCEENDKKLKCDFIIERGHYYVDGILCENPVPVFVCPGPGDSEAPDPPPLYYSEQPDYPLNDELQLKANDRYLVYLDVWERHLTHLQAEHVREVALGGPDTATRAKVVWQVKAKKIEKQDMEETEGDCATLLTRLVPDGPRCLRARARVEEPSDDPCILPPEARYRGAENQLYRVEIHDGGPAGKDGATFKWSRDNGSVAFAIRELPGSVAKLESLGPDDRFGLKEDQWVEIVDDHSVLRGEPGFLVKVDAVDRVGFEVTFSVPDGASKKADLGEDSSTHPLLRRWDQGSDAIAVAEGKWIELEDGVQVYFEPGGTYRTGDYWLIPARTATGDVEWPSEAGPDGKASPKALPPLGIEHHYAPLALISLEDGSVTCDEDECRCSFAPLRVCSARRQPGEDGGGEASIEDKIATLMEIDEVGETRAKMLLEAGHETLAAVAALEIEVIMEILKTAGVTVTVARRIKASAVEKAAGQA